MGSLTWSKRRRWSIELEQTAPRKDFIHALVQPSTKTTVTMASVLTYSKQRSWAIALDIVLLLKKSVNLSGCFGYVSDVPQVYPAIPPNIWRSQSHQDCPYHTSRDLRHVRNFTSL